MHSLLFVLDEPKDQQAEAYKKWITCCEKTCAKLSRAPDDSIDILAKNVIMMRVENGSLMLGQLLQCAEEHHSAYRILYFESEPAWSSFSASEIENTSP
jgi:hypothetical protein